MVLRKRKKSDYSLLELIGVFVSIIVLGIALYYAAVLIGMANESEEQSFIVVNVSDGDTFEIATGDKVRLICVNTPEKGVKGYAAASNYLSDLILNKKVRLETDVNDVDSYGRLLRYVYIDDSSGSEIFVNKEIVSRGFGVVYRYGEDTSLCDEIEGK